MVSSGAGRSCCVRQRSRCRSIGALVRRGDGTSCMLVLVVVGPHCVHTQDTTSRRPTSRRIASTQVNQPSCEQHKSSSSSRERVSGVKSKWRIVNLTNAAAVPSLSVWTPLLFSQASDLQDCQNNDTACDRSRSADYGIYGKVPNLCKTFA